MLNFTYMSLRLGHIISLFYLCKGEVFLSLSLSLCLSVCLCVCVDPAGVMNISGKFNNVKITWNQWIRLSSYYCCCWRCCCSYCCCWCRFYTLILSQYDKFKCDILLGELVIFFFFFSSVPLLSFAHLM